MLCRLFSFSSSACRSRGQSHTHPNHQRKLNNQYDEEESEHGEECDEVEYEERERARSNSYYYDPHNDRNDGYELSSCDNNRYPQAEMFFTDARSNRMVQNEALIREEMFRECTFRPKIKELPSSYGIGKSNKGESVHHDSHSALLFDDVCVTVGA